MKELYFLNLKLFMPLFFLSIFCLVLGNSEHESNPVLMFEGLEELLLLLLLLK